jgi:hypothetical protein
MKITFTTTDKEQKDVQTTLLYNTVKRCAEDLQSRLPQLQEIKLEIMKLSAYNPSRQDNVAIRHNLSDSESSLIITVSYFFPVSAEVISAQLSKELKMIKDLYY